MAHTGTQREGIPIAYKELEDLLDKQKAIIDYPKQVELNKKLEAVIQQQKKTNESLQERNKVLEDLRIKYLNDEFTLRDFDNFLKDERKEYRRVLQGKDAEKRAEDLLPGKVIKKINEYSQSYPSDVPIEFMKAVETLVDKRTKDLLLDKDNWPKWLHDRVQQKVTQDTQAGLDAEFEDRLKRATNEKVAQKTGVEWPRYVKDNIHPFITQSIQQQLLKLQNPIRGTCNKCGTDYEYGLTQDMISDLYRTGFTIVDCPNPACRGFRNRTHVIKIDFEDIIGQLMQEPLLYSKKNKKENDE